MHRAIDNIAALAEMQSQREGSGEGVSLDDFYALHADAHYIFAPTREMWPARKRQCARAAGSALRRAWPSRCSTTRASKLSAQPARGSIATGRSSR